MAQSALSQVRGERFEWDEEKRLALQLLAEGGRTYQQISDELGWPKGGGRVRLWELRKTPQFAAALDEVRSMLEEETKAYAVANRHALLEGLTERRERLLRIVSEREEYHQAHQTQHPGATTGYMVKDVKNIGSGPTAYPVDVWAVDKALVSALDTVEGFGAKLAGLVVDKSETDLQVGVHQGPPLVLRVRNQEQTPYTPNREGMDPPGRYAEAEDGVWRDVESGEPFDPETVAIPAEVEAESTPLSTSDVEAKIDWLREKCQQGYLEEADFRAEVARLRGHHPGGTR